MKALAWVRKLHPRHSLVAKMSYAFALVSLVLSVILSYYAAEISRDQIEREQGASFVRRAQHIVDVLNRSMFERYREMQIVASLDDIRNPSVSIDKKRAVLEKLQLNFDAYAWIGICNPEGLGIVGTSGYLEKVDLSKRPWCRDGRENPFVGDVHDALKLAKLLPNPSGEKIYLVDVAAPVKDEQGILQGVLCGHIYWGWAKNLLKDKNEDLGIEILLLSRDGLVLAGPEQNSHPLSGLAPHTWQRIHTAGTQDDYMLDTWQNGKRYLIGHAHDTGYRDYPGLGWIAVVRQDAAQAFAPAKALQQHILWVGLGLGVLFMLIGAAMARRIARPISLISEAADKVAAGNLTYDAPQQSGDGEVAHLSQAIHTMVNHLTQEIQERKNAEVQLQLSAAVFANNTEGIVITDTDNRIVRVNGAFSRISGYTEAEVLGQDPRIFSSGKMSPKFYQTMWRDFLRNDGWRGEIINKRKNNETYPEWLILSLVRDESGKVINHIAIYSDISERKREEERIQYLATHDMLTQLPNRYLLMDRLTQALGFAEHHHVKVGVMFIDLDHFKNINDSLGHEVGDTLLQHVADRIRQCLRTHDTLARLGGDEFVIVLPEMHSESEAAYLAEKILEGFDKKFNIDTFQLTITPSIGISIYPDDGVDSTTLLRNADMAMYRAKDGGRNMLQFYLPEMTLHVNERLQLEMQLRLAIERHELCLLYQPQIDTQTHKMTGMEALLRWQHPTFGLVSPTRFIPIAEESGLIIEIGDWVLHEACMQGRIWQAQGYELVPIAVNVSGVQFKRGQFLDRLKNILHDTRFPANLLEIEITESVLMDLGDASLQFMNEIKSLGATLALDDFGTGFSSLSRLKTFPLDFLKVDQSFVRDIHTDPDDAAIVRAVIGMAHEMNIEVIAEGVENQAQLDFLQALQCEKCQGYFFSEPISAEHIEAFLQRK
ncbi:MAG: EAL domain-containing protein [Gallionella sp.]|nr:EAL domain-containing protein [Gallionella sp.]MDD4959226.1 EAL domain-containing protein [Gallionella sp.]